jgi:hypothetical protein
VGYVKSPRYCLIESENGRFSKGKRDRSRGMQIAYFPPSYVFLKPHITTVVLT